MDINEVLKLMDYGFAVHPCAAGGKAPILYDWPNRRMTRWEARDLWARDPNLNVGMVCGATGWVVVDLDAQANVDGGLANLPETPLMVRSGSGDGLHMFYRWPVGMPVKKSKILLPWVRDGRPGKVRPGNGADLFGDGSQVVLPPSIHPSGNRYEWVNGLVPTEQVPFFNLEWLVG